jgi:pyruvate/2-oxoglutarate dehydrogenase complex dihydrolipoamide acyltransferase (E2) component
MYLDSSGKAAYTTLGTDVGESSSHHLSLMGRVKFREYEPGMFRKIACGSWRTAGDPSVYALLEIEMSKALEFAKAYSQQHGVRITPTHLVAKAITHCLQVRPELNGLLRRGKVYLRRNVSIFFHVNVPGRVVNGDRDERIAKAVLSGTTVHETETKGLAEIARAHRAQAAEVKRGRDPSFAACLRIVSLLPWRLVRSFLNLSSWLVYGLNLDLGFLGLAKDPFGSVMITNLGGMGIDVAWVPLVPYSRVPLLLALGTIRDKAVVENGEVKVRPVLSIGVTFDHRLIDGVHAAQMSDEFKKCFAEPEKYLGGQAEPR